MQKLIELILSWPALKKYRTRIVQVLFVALAAYKGTVGAGWVPNVLDPDVETALIAVLGAYGLKFSKEHQP